MQSTAVRKNMWGAWAMPPKGFGEKVREYRKRCEMTQSELSAKVGVVYVTVGDWERGKRSPSRDNMVSLVDALGLTPREQDELYKLWTDRDPKDDRPLDDGDPFVIRGTASGEPEIRMRVTPSLRKLLNAIKDSMNDLTEANKPVTQ